MSENIDLLKKQVEHLREENKLLKEWILRERAEFLEDLKDLRKRAQDYELWVFFDRWEFIYNKWIREAKKNEIK